MKPKKPKPLRLSREQWRHVWMALKNSQAATCPTKCCDGILQRVGVEGEIAADRGVARCED